MREQAEGRDWILCNRKRLDITKGVGNLKDVQVKYDIDPNVKPVSQHLRKIPFYMRKKINVKLEELIEYDVFELVPATEATA